MSGQVQLREALGKLQNKFFNLTDNKVDFRFKLEWFATSQEQPRVEPDYLILAFVEVTNRSKDPYEFSKLMVRFGGQTFHSFDFTMKVEPGAGRQQFLRVKVGRGTALFRTPDNLRAPAETLDLLKRAYLQQNQSASGLCLLEVDKSIAFETINPEFGALLAGYPNELWYSEE